MSQEQRYLWGLLLVVLLELLVISYTYGTMGGFPISYPSNILILCCGFILLYGVAAWRLKHVGSIKDSALQSLTLMGTLLYGAIVLYIGDIHNVYDNYVTLSLLLSGVFISFILSSSMTLNFTLIIFAFWSFRFIFPDEGDVFLADYISQYLPISFLLLSFIVFLKNNIGLVLWYIIFFGCQYLLSLSQIDLFSSSVESVYFFIPILSHLFLWWGSKSLEPFSPWLAKVSAGFNYGMLNLFACIMGCVGISLYGPSILAMFIYYPMALYDSSIDFSIMVANIIFSFLTSHPIEYDYSIDFSIIEINSIFSFVFILFIGGVIQNKYKLISVYDISTIIVVGGILLGVSFNTHGVVFPFLLFVLSTILILRGYYEDKVWQMILGIFLLIIDYVVITGTWGFVPSAVFFLCMGAVASLGTRMTRRLIS